MMRSSSHIAEKNVSMNLLYCMKIIVLLAIFLFSGCATKAALTDKDVGYYTTVNDIKFKPIIIKDSSFALVVDYSQSCASTKQSEKSSVIQVIDLRELSRPKLFSVIDLAQYTNVINDIKVSKDGTRMYVSTPTALMVFDIAELNNARLIEDKPLPSAGHIVLTPDNRYLYVFGRPEGWGSKAKKILLYEVKEKLTFLKSFNRGGSYHFSISPDGKKMASLTDIGNALVLADISDPLALNILGSDGDTYNNRGEFDPSGRVADIAFSADSQRLYVAGGPIGLLVYDISANRLDKVQQTSHFYSRYVFNQTGGIGSVAILGDQIYLAGGSDEARKDLSFIKGFDKATLFPGGGLTLSPDGSFLIYQNSGVKERALIIKKLSKQTK